jgi:hypothetical protein
MLVVEIFEFLLNSYVRVKTVACHEDEGGRGRDIAPCILKLITRLR